MVNYYIFNTLTTYWTIGSYILCVPPGTYPMDVVIQNTNEYDYKYFKNFV